jgi:hypothetical protein
MRRTTSGPLTALTAAVLVLLSWVSIKGDVDSQIHIVPLHDVLGQTGLRDLGVFVLSGEEALVEVPARDAERLDVLSSAGLGARGTLPLYMVPGQVPDEALAAGVEEGGIEVLHSDEKRIIFRARPEAAYRLDRQGYSVARIDFTPLSRLADTPDARPVYENLVAARPLTTARVDFMKSMSESVNADSLHDFIYFLSYDSGEGDYRSRFAARYDLDEDVTPELERRLEDYLVPAGGSVHTMEFDLWLGDSFKGQAEVGTNVWGYKPGTRTTAHYIICAHFDATASRDDGFDTTWVETAAPGANDNATGAAGVIECARLMAPMTLDFGVTFMLFSAEENLGMGGMRGSRAYIAEVLSETDSIIGVINMDMFGYSEDYKKVEITYGWRSEWLSSELVLTADSLGLGTPFEGIQRPGLYNSDHSSFWRVGVPALMLSERNRDDFPIPIYPYYHSAADTLGHLDMDQVSDNVALVVGYISRFADIPGDSLSDIVVTPESMEFNWVGRSEGFPFVAGEDLTLNVRALNEGGSMPGPTVYTLKVWEGGVGTGTLVHEGPLSLEVVSGGIAEAGATWKTASTVYGDIDYSVSLVPLDDDVESDVTNNDATATVTVTPIQTVIENLHIYPNPAGDPGEAFISGDVLTSQTNFLARYVTEIFDVTGLLLLRGEGQIESPDLEIPFSSLDGRASQLPPRSIHLYSQVERP